MRNRWKWGIGIAVVILVIIQLIRPARSNPPITAEETIHSRLPVDPVVDAALIRSCNDCHSNLTGWPWYTNVAPASWLIVSDVRRGRVELNFSEWGTYTLNKVTHCCPEQLMNMTYLALRFSHYINGVAMHHGEVSQGMFPGYPINAITNGVHAVTWTSPPFRELYDRYPPAWRNDNLYLRYAIELPLEEIRHAHAAAKYAFLEEIRKRAGVELKDSVLTIGFARRAIAYKRADLLFSDLNRLRRIAREIGPLQIVYGGKAHPRTKVASF
jgi:glucan phosphorylase